MIGVYLLETDDGPALFDCGPTTCLDTLKKGLAGHGLALVRHSSSPALSHPPRPRGRCGPFVREHPGLQVHVSEIGAPHLVDPSRLEASARRLYGDAFDALWGELAPVPEKNVHVVGDDVLGLACFPTPGHASHHVSFLPPTARSRRRRGGGPHRPGRYVIPVSPPPDFDPRSGCSTLDEIERRRPERLALIHFGVAEDVETHLAMTREELARWVERVELGATEQEFVDAARRDIAARVPEDPDSWQRAAPFGSPTEASSATGRRSARPRRLQPHERRARSRRCGAPAPPCVGRRRSRCRRRASLGRLPADHARRHSTHQGRYLGAIASGSVNYLLWEPDAIDARVHLDAGCLRYRSTIHVVFDGQEEDQIGSGTPTTTKGATDVGGWSGRRRPATRRAPSPQRSAVAPAGSRPSGRFARSANVTPPSSEMVASRTSSQTSRSVQPTVIGHGSGLCLVAQLIGASWPWNASRCARA